MELSDLHIFRTVVQEGGITRAASVLHRVQSNVTTRIRQLEEKLGTPLFVRENKRMFPTAAGRLLFEYAERLLQLAQEAQEAVATGQPRGSLRLGSMESTAAARLPPVLAAFHQSYPDVRLELHTGATGKMLARVVEGSLDCALVSAPVNDSRLEQVPVFAEELVLIAPSGHPPVRSATDLVCRTLLTFEAGCAYRHRLESWLAAAGVVPERVVELFSYHAMVGCASAGMGVALAPMGLMSLMSNASAVSIHRLPPEFAQVTTVLVSRPGFRSPATEALKNLMLAVEEVVA